MYDLIMRRDVWAFCKFMDCDANMADLMLETRDFYESRHFEIHTPAKGCVAFQEPAIKNGEFLMADLLILIRF